MLARLLSLVLLVAVGLPTVAPALALGQDPDAGLPVCCRRHGLHHCTMAADRTAGTALESSQPRASAICPYYPQHEVAPVTGAHLLALHVPQRAAFYIATLAPIARARADRQNSFERSHYKRGPPVLILRLA